MAVLYFVLKVLQIVHVAKMLSRVLAEHVPDRVADFRALLLAFHYFNYYKLWKLDVQVRLLLMAN